MKLISIFRKGALFLVLTLFAACSDDIDSSSNEGSGDSNAPLSYSYLTQNRGYIGGSLIWNPDNGASQLKAGTKVAVRLGRLTEKTINLKEYDSTTDVEIKDSDFTISDFESNSTAATTSFKTTFNGGSSTKKVFEDNPSKAIYGYISIESIDANSIRFTYTRVSENNSKSSKSVEIQKGKSADLDNDDYADIKYDEPDIQRTGYNGARWLTFINEKTKPYSSMYYTFTSSAARAGYRATTEEAEIVEEGLYGVNSEGNFIYITYKDDPDNYDGLTHGDYIVSLSQYKKTGTDDDIYATITDGDKIPDDYDPMSEANKDEFLNYAGNQDVNFKYVDDDNYNSCYLVTKNTKTDCDYDLAYVTRDEFAKHSVDYDYVLYQFPDQDDGPSELIKDMADASSETEAAEKAKINAVRKAFMEANGKQETDSLPTKNTDCISYLNTALTNEAFFNAIVENKVTADIIDNVDTADEAKELCKSHWKSATKDEAKKQITRILIDEVYDSSPYAVVDPPTLESAYPTVAANIGSVNELNEDAFRYADVYSSIYEQDTYGRALYGTGEWEKFKSKRDEIRENWKKYHQFSLLALLFPGKAVEMKKAGLDIGVGVKGSVTNPSGQFRVDAGIALCMDIDLSIETLTSVAADLGVSAPAGKNMSELLKKIFENKKDCTVQGTDVQVQIGPIPLVFGFAVRSGINFDLGALSPHLAFVGMCGGDAFVDVHYGRKFIIPYVNVDTGASGFATKEMFVGIANPEAMKEDGTNITFEPWINLTPSAGVGKSCLSARVSFPITLGTEFKFAIKPKETVPIVFNKCAYTVKVEFMPYAEVKLWFVKFRLTITKKTITNNELVLYELPKGFYLPPEWRKRE